jgi:hypothetical protein
MTTTTTNTGSENMKTETIETLAAEILACTTLEDFAPLAARHSRIAHTLPHAGAVYLGRLLESVSGRLLREQWAREDAE